MYWRNSDPIPGPFRQKLTHKSQLNLSPHPGQFRLIIVSPMSSRSVGIDFMATSQICQVHCSPLRRMIIFRIVFWVVWRISRRNPLMLRLPGYEHRVDGFPTWATAVGIRYQMKINASYSMLKSDLSHLLWLEISIEISRNPGNGHKDSKWLHSLGLLSKTPPPKHSIHGAWLSKHPVYCSFLDPSPPLYEMFHQYDITILYSYITFSPINIHFYCIASHLYGFSSDQ